MDQPAKKAWFFQHTECEYFPCHSGVYPGDFNCLSCFCPLYTLGARCGGRFSYTPKGIKNCIDCPYPHQRGNYLAIMDRFPEIAEKAKRSGEF